MPYKKKWVKKSGRIKHANRHVQKFKALSKKNRKPQCRTLFLNLYSPHIITGLSLYTPSFSPLLGSQQSWLSAQIQKVILQSSLCVQTFQHISLLQGTSAYVHRDSAYTREFSLYRLLALLNKPEGTASSAVTQQRCPTTTTTHSRDWEQRPLFDRWHLFFKNEQINSNTDMK